MYTATSRILSKYTGSYTDFVTDRIFKPLGMDSTTFSPNEAAKSGQLTQTWTGHGRRIPYWISEDQKEFNAGAGGVISSVIDLVSGPLMYFQITHSLLLQSKWIRALLKIASSSGGETVIPKSVYEATTTSNAIASGQPSGPEFSVQGYGMGWFRFSYQGHDVRPLPDVTRIHS